MSAVPVSFVLLSEVSYPDPAQLIEAASGFGIGLTHSQGDGQTLTFDIAGGGTLFVALMPAPHPDAAGMATGPFSPDPAVVQQHVAHYIVTTMGEPQGLLPDNVLISVLTTAVIRSSPAVAAMLGAGVIFYQSNIFASMIESSGLTTPVGVTVDITAVQESADRMSFLTHGLSTYGREEFYVTASITGKGAIEYLMGMVQWMVSDPDKVLPTGDTVGRTPEEKIVVQRVPSPIAGNPQVIRLDMDTETKPKKKGFFRKG